MAVDCHHKYMEFEQKRYQKLLNELDQMIDFDEMSGSSLRNSSDFGDGGRNNGQNGVGKRKKIKDWYCSLKGMFKWMKNKKQKRTSGHKGVN